MPVTKLVNPGPVVATTTVSLPLARDDSIAANAAPVSLRQCIKRIGLLDTAEQKGAMPPPNTPKACSTPISTRAATRASDAHVEGARRWVPAGTTSERATGRSDQAGAASLSRAVLSRASRRSVGLKDSWAIAVWGTSRLIGY